MPHPASRILIYLLAALAFPGLPFFMVLPVLLLALLILRVQRRSPLNLLFRTRWLLLVLLFGYAYSLPGEPLWQAFGSLSPSREGILRGAASSIHLIVLLLWLDVLVLSMPVNDLLAGLFQLMRPIAKMGLAPHTAALRLGLTLRAIEDLERGSGNLRGLLNLGHSVPIPQQFSIQLLPLRVFDVVTPGLLFALFICDWAIFK
ncbi:MAG: hypothetical protein B7Y41_12260 [Hydrogenophilales bacterium 28-61-23]|nr:MAG: hypothetical protein B7Y41_12260 [Hydrogenophilales bacterium 28-61-23]